MREITLSNSNIWILSGYGVGFALYQYFILTGLTASIFGYAFPNLRFMTLLALFLLANLAIGLGVRKYINNFTEDTKNKMRTLFVGTTIFSFVVTLIIVFIT